MDRVLLGSVGANRILRSHPLGADFLAGLRAAPWSSAATLREFDWSPIAISQELQASGERWDRVVLVGPVDRGWAEGTVRTRRWIGVALGNDAIQARMYEAVTGVLSLDNLLVIGSHFKVWPATVIVVEVQLDAECFGRLVAAEAIASPGKVVGLASPDSATQRITDQAIEACGRAVSGDAAWLERLPVMTAADLSPVGEWYRHRALAAAVVGLAS